MLIRGYCHAQGVVGNYFGTKKRPVLVPTMNDERVVGCIGPADAEHAINWLNIKLGEMGRCQVCGQCFAIYKVEGPYYPTPLSCPPEGLEAAVKANKA
jgi:ribosomal protein L3